MAASTSYKDEIAVRKWVYLGGMSSCFGAVVGAPRVRDVVSTLPRYG